jgi:superfamily II DNA or RNA helicase
LVLPSASRPPSASESQLILSRMQANTLDLLKNCDPKGRRVLIVQPCCTGKSVYYTHFAKQKNTMVMLAQPFTSLKQQSESDAAKANLVTVVQRGGPLKDLLRNEGILLICSYEKFHTQVSRHCTVVPRLLLSYVVLNTSFRYCWQNKLLQKA